MQKYLNKLEQLKEAGIKYILSIGKRQPMHIGHKRSLERILAIDGVKLIYVIGSANKGGEALFDPFVNPLTIDQQIEQFKRALPNKEAIFLPIIDVVEMSEWGPIIVNSLIELKITPQECAIHFIGKPEDKLLKPSSFKLPNGESVILEAGRWLAEAMAYYKFSMWFDNEIEVDLSISARNLRKLDLEKLTEEQKALLATPEYLLELARHARVNNVEKVGPITLEDLSLERIRLEL